MPHRSSGQNGRAAKQPGGDAKMVIAAGEQQQRSSPVSMRPAIAGGAENAMERPIQEHPFRATVR